MPAEGDLRTSATERYRRGLESAVRVKRWGKSPPGPWQHGFYAVNSIPEQRRGEAEGLPDRFEEAA